MLAPAPKSDAQATARSITIGIGRLTGPREPGPAPTIARISSSVAMVRGEATSGCFSALISFNSWSPRTRRATISESTSSDALTIKVLIVFSIGRLCCSTSAAMVLASGVSTKRISSVGASGAALGAIASAISTLAA